VDVYLNGIKLSATDYTASNGTTVVLSSGCTVDDQVDIIKWDSFEVANVVTTINGSSGAITGIATDSSLVSERSATTVLSNKTIHGNSNTITVDGVNEIGYKHIPQVSASTAYTCGISDAGKHILHPSSDTTARVFTIPANASVAYPIGAALTFINQNSAGVVTIAITSDVMRLAGAGTTGSRTLAANGIATAIKITNTEWIISGAGLT